MLEVRDLSVVTETGQSILDSVSFSVEASRTLALVGESGSGKSMTALALMRLLPDALRITAGGVILDGENVLELPEREMVHFRGKRLAMIFQEPSTSLNPVMTVGEQIAEVLQLHSKINQREAKRVSIDWLKRVGIPEAERRVDAYPFELSGGQKQRVMIAMALAANPEVVIADEPTTALDVTLQSQILNLLKELQRESRVALLLITHDLALVKQYADDVALMYAGQIVEQASCKAFFEHPEHPYARGLLRAVPTAQKRSVSLEGISGAVQAFPCGATGCRFAARCRFAESACWKQDIKTGETESGHWVRCLKRNMELPQDREKKSRIKVIGHEVLTLKDVSVTYESGNVFFRKKTFNAVKHVSLSLKTGETLAVVGESGSGKTTLAKAALRLLDSNVRIEGEALIGGVDMMKARGRDLLKVRQFAQIVFQDPFASLNPRMSVGECLEEGMLSLMEMTKTQRRERIREVLELVGLDENCAGRMPHEFSGGQRQRITLARALVVNPKIIVCDEPTSALDVSVQAQILNLMQDIQQRTSVAYLFITHNFSVVEYLADTVAVMKNGELVEYGSAEEILRAPKQPYTKELLMAVPYL